MELVRWPSEVPTTFAVRTFTRGIDLVLDVGANDGGFAKLLRKEGFSRQILSFEPVPESFSRLSQNMARDSLWSGEMLALGARDENRQINVASNDGASSSLLKFLRSHTDAAPEIHFVDSKDVSVVTLDGLGIFADIGDKSLALKLDVQGFEKEVLIGAERTLDAVHSVWIELSIAPLYAGSWDYREAIDYLGKRGFELAQVVPGFHDQKGQLLQFDGVFLNTRHRKGSAR